MISFKSLIILLIFPFIALSSLIGEMSLQEFESHEIIAGRTNVESALDKPYVIMVSLDGFRYDYAKRYGAKNILNIAENGAHASRLIPAFPSKTFPNHYTIATGMYPANHGIISNAFSCRCCDDSYYIGDREQVKNAKWYEGIPIWNLVEQHGMLSGSVFWIGTEAPINGLYSNYYFDFNSKVPSHVRVEKVLKWLNLPQEARPHLITLYYSLTDTIGHKFGPISDEMKDAVLEMDYYVGALRQGIKQSGLPVTLIITSDHGMTEVNSPLNIRDFVDLGENRFVSGPVAFIYTKNEAETDRLYDELTTFDAFQTYRRDALPDYLNYDNSNRLGDLVLISEAPVHLDHWIDKPPFYYNSKGNHGFDPFKNRDMSGIFYMEGPRVKKGFRSPPFENIHIYPLLAELLGLKIEHEIDGKIESVEHMLIKTEK